MNLIISIALPLSFPLITQTARSKCVFKQKPKKIKQKPKGQDQMTALQAQMEDILKYQRLQGAVEAIVARDRITVSSCTKNTIILGTESGEIHIISLAGAHLQHYTAHPGKSIISISATYDGLLNILSCAENDDTVQFCIVNHEGDIQRQPYKFQEPIALVTLELYPLSSSSSGNNSNTAPPPPSGNVYHHGPGTFLYATNGHESNCVILYRPGKSFYSRREVILHDSNAITGSASNTDNNNLMNSTITALTWRAGLAAWCDSSLGMIYLFDTLLMSAMSKFDLPGAFPSPNNGNQLLRSPIGGGSGSGSSNGLPYPCSLTWLPNLRSLSATATSTTSKQQQSVALASGTSSGQGGVSARALQLVIAYGYTIKIMRCIHPNHGHSHGGSSSQGGGSSSQQQTMMNYSLLAVEKVAEWNTDTILCRNVALLDAEHLVYLGYTPPTVQSMQQQGQQPAGGDEGIGEEEDDGYQYSITNEPEVIICRIPYYHAAAGGGNAAGNPGGNPAGGGAGTAGDTTIVSADVLPLRGPENYLGPFAYTLLATPSAFTAATAHGSSASSNSGSNCSWSVKDYSQIRGGDQGQASCFYFLASYDIILGRLRDVNDRVRSALALAGQAGVADQQQPSAAANGLQLASQALRTACEIARCDLTNLTYYRYPQLLEAYIHDLIHVQSQYSLAAREVARLLALPPSSNAGAVAARAGGPGAAGGAGAGQSIAALADKGSSNNNHNSSMYLLWEIYIYQFKNANLLDYLALYLPTYYYNDDDVYSHSQPPSSSSSSSSSSQPAVLVLESYLYEEVWQAILEEYPAMLLPLLMKWCGPSATSNSSSSHSHSSKRSNQAGSHSNGSVLEISACIQRLQEKMQSLRRWQYQQAQLQQQQHQHHQPQGSCSQGSFSHSQGSFSIANNTRRTISSSSATGGGSGKGGLLATQQPAIQPATIQEGVGNEEDDDDTGNLGPAHQQQQQQQQQHKSISYYLEALAYLYSLRRDFEQALNCYLDVDYCAAPAAAIASSTTVISNSSSQSSGGSVASQQSGLVYRKAEPAPILQQQQQQAQLVAAANHGRHAQHSAAHHDYRHVFELIERQSLFKVIEHRLVNLIFLSPPLASRLLLLHSDVLTIRNVVKHLLTSATTAAAGQASSASAGSAASTGGTVGQQSAASTAGGKAGSTAGSIVLLWYLHTLFTDGATTKTTTTTTAGATIVSVVTVGSNSRELYANQEYEDLHIDQLYLYLQYYTSFRGLPTPVHQLSASGAAAGSGGSSSGGGGGGGAEYLLPYLKSGFIREELAIFEVEKYFKLFNNNNINMNMLANPATVIATGNSSVSGNLANNNNKPPPYLYQEMVYLWSKIGQARKALSLLMYQVGDLRQCLSFLEEVYIDTNNNNNSYNSNNHSYSDSSNNNNSLMLKELYEDLIKFSFTNQVFLLGLFDQLGRSSSSSSSSSTSLFDAQLFFSHFVAMQKQQAAIGAGSGTGAGAGNSTAGSVAAITLQIPELRQRLQQLFTRIRECEQTDRSARNILQQDALVLLHSKNYRQRRAIKIDGSDTSPFLYAGSNQHRYMHGSNGGSGGSSAATAGLTYLGMRIGTVGSLVGGSSGSGFHHAANSVDSGSAPYVVKCPHCLRPLVAEPPASTSPSSTAASTAGPARKDSNYHLGIVIQSSKIMYHRPCYDAYRLARYEKEKDELLKLQQMQLQQQKQQQQQQERDMEGNLILPKLVKKDTSAATVQDNMSESASVAGGSGGGNGGGSGGGYGSSISGGASRLLSSSMSMGMGNSGTSFSLFPYHRPSIR